MDDERFRFVAARMRAISSQSGGLDLVDLVNYATNLRAENAALREVVEAAWTCRKNTLKWRLARDGNFCLVPQEDFDALHATLVKVEDLTNA